MVLLSLSTSGVLSLCLFVSPPSPSFAPQFPIFYSPPILLPFSLSLLPLPPFSLIHQLFPHLSHTAFSTFLSLSTLTVPFLRLLLPLPPSPSLFIISPPSSSFPSLSLSFSIFPSLLPTLSHPLSSVPVFPLLLLPPSSFRLTPSSFSPLPSFPFPPSLYVPLL